MPAGKGYATFQGGYATALSHEFRPPFTIPMVAPFTFSKAIHLQTKQVKGGKYQHMRPSETG